MHILINILKYGLGFCIIPLIAVWFLPKLIAVISIVLLAIITVILDTKYN